MNFPKWFSISFSRTAHAPHTFVYIHKIFLSMGNIFSFFRTFIRMWVQEGKSLFSICALKKILFKWKKLHSEIISSEKGLLNKPFNKFQKCTNIFPFCVRNLPLKICWMRFYWKFNLLIAKGKIQKNEHTILKKEFFCFPWKVCKSCVINLFLFSLL